ncbi:MAG: fucose isomerase [Clostridiaceae bacterium]|nr:fucose isomerase [Clostridiaceae bacterium]
MPNCPSVTLGIVAVSRDCFLKSLAENRRRALVAACTSLSLPVYECPVLVENESDARAALAELAGKCNVLVVYLGNFGPETPETLLAQRFSGPSMFIAAAEDRADALIDGRGDAFCGLLNCSYNLSLRNITAYIPAHPVGTPDVLAEQIRAFIPIARAILGVCSLKIISFGPRPQDFFACNAPIRQLYDLGVEVEENSELDLLVAYRAHANDPRIPGVAADMTRELGDGNRYPDLLPRMAQFELTLLDWADTHKGMRDYVAFANKCWPAFPGEFGFEPCYVNSRLASRGIPVACEVDLYGALSEYILACLTEDAVTLLDINNTVPADMYASDVAGHFPYRCDDLFMGFHCGNTPLCKLACGSICYQLIQNRLLEDKGEPNITRGTLEGDLAPGAITLFRVQGAADGSIRAYVAPGEALPVATRSFGGIGVLAVRELARFYRYVLIERHFPHHAAVAFSDCARAAFEVLRFLGVREIAYNQPASVLYSTENPF